MSLCSIHCCPFRNCADLLCRTLSSGAGCELLGSCREKSKGRVRLSEVQLLELRSCRTWLHCWVAILQAWERHRGCQWRWRERAWWRGWWYNDCSNFWIVFSKIFHSFSIFHVWKVYKTCDYTSGISEYWCPSTISTSTIALFSSGCRVRGFTSGSLSGSRRGLWDDYLFYGKWRTEGQGHRRWRRLWRVVVVVIECVVNF